MAQRFVSQPKGRDALIEQVSLLPELTYAASKTGTRSCGSCTFKVHKDSNVTNQILLARGKIFEMHTFLVPLRFPCEGRRAAITSLSKRPSQELTP